MTGSGWKCLASWAVWAVAMRVPHSNGPSGARRDEGAAGGVNRNPIGRGACPQVFNFLITLFRQRLLPRITPPLPRRRGSYYGTSRPADLPDLPVAPVFAI